MSNLKANTKDAETSKNTSKIFDDLYKNLNKGQKKAVDTVEGPVMVVAGPGTGKTSILTLRIANILRVTDVSPDSILALTFTEAGVQAMKKKLLSIIGPSAHKVNIHTFHGFSNRIIEEYPEKFPRIIGSMNVSDMDKIRIVEDIIMSSESVLLRPWGDPLYYVAKIISEISSLKKDGITVAILRESLKNAENELNARTDIHHEKGAHKGKKKSEIVELEKNLEKNKELLSVYEKYEKVMLDKKLYDYEDMIMEFVNTMRNDSEFLLTLQEKFQYILADEHQDANNSQNAILELLSNFHQNPNLFIVGDEKQAIYRFQGASLENFLYFRKLYPEALLINLEDNYRSTKSILDASHSLILNNQARGIDRIQLKSNSKADESKIYFAEFSKRQFEVRYIASKIKELIEKGKVKPEEIAIIYRGNRESTDIANALSRAGIPYRVESDTDLMNDYRIRAVMALVRAIAEPSDNLALSEVICARFLNLSHIDYFRILKASSQNKSGYIFDIINSEERLKNIGVESAEKFIDLANKISEWFKKSKEIPFSELFERVIKDSGYLKYLLNSDNYLENMTVIDTFYAEIRKMARGRQEYFLRDFIESIELMKGHKILMKGNVAGVNDGRVRLLTAHKSKGLEFEFVFISGANSKKWEASRGRTAFKLPEEISKSSESVKDIEDERRLFYVAITRAKKRVYITCSKQDENDREDIRTDFLAEIDQSLIEADQKEIEKAESEYASDLTYYFEHTEAPIKDEDAEYIRKTFATNGLSVTHLNNYLECPWKYFFVNLIRIPQAQSRSQIYGTAIHETLRTYFNKYKEEAELSIEEAIKVYEHELSRLPILRTEYNEILEKGKKSLSTYFKNYEGTWNRNLLTEYAVKGIAIQSDINFQDAKLDILLNGKLDKIEFIDTNHVNVVDYKTGAPKSENAIKGLTKDSNGNYYRQLIFYKLLLDLDKEKGLIMDSGELDFIESDEKGKNKKMRFEISASEVEEIRNTILRVAQEIMDLSFWKLGCQKPDCEFCKLSKDLKS